MDERDDDSDRDERDGTSADGSPDDEPGDDDRTGGADGPPGDDGLPGDDGRADEERTPGDGGPSDDGTAGDEESPDGHGTSDVEGLRAEVRDLREDLAAFEDSVEDRTVHRSEVESELKRYVRGRLRRGHARGWGPYLVLLYGTAMTIGAFALLSGGWAILAMVVIWLSTLGLYVLMLLVGVGIGLLQLPGKGLDAIRDRR